VLKEWSLKQRPKAAQCATKPLDKGESDVARRRRPSNTLEIIGVCGVHFLQLQMKTADLRIPLLLCDMDGLSYREVAESLGLSLSATKMRIKRAREHWDGPNCDQLRSGWSGAWFRSCLWTWYLGCRFRNIVTGFYTRNLLAIGKTAAIAGHTRTLAAITPTHTVLLNEGHEILVPNKTFAEQTSTRGSLLDKARK
jgi:hypothetical protein